MDSNQRREKRDEHRTSLSTSTLIELLISTLEGNFLKIYSGHVYNIFYGNIAERVKKEDEEAKQKTTEKKWWNEMHDIKKRFELKIRNGFRSQININWENSFVFPHHRSSLLLRIESFSSHVSWWLCFSFNFSLSSPFIMISSFLYNSLK